MHPDKILTVDIGNTATKCSVFEGERLVQSVVMTGSSVEGVEMLMLLHHVEGASYSCVGEDKGGILEYLKKESGIPVLELTHTTPLPIEICYDTPQTLGLDRIAGAVGVSDGRASLLVDAGTAVTIDLVAGGSFKGGNISPGLRLRKEALHGFTSHLPLVRLDGELPVLGHDTDTAIRSGVVRGLQYEIEGALRYASTQYPDIKLILTGGDAQMMARVLRESGVECELLPSAVGLGLVRIFHYNNSER